jgi:glutamate 5-kinase
MAARKQWLAGQLRVSGRLYLDSGAVDVLCRSGRSLLAVGVQRLEGNFLRGELVSCIHSETGTEIARGLVNYSSEETVRILGKPSTAIEGILGYMSEPELIHRDNIVML